MRCKRIDSRTCSIKNIKINEHELLSLISFSFSFSLSYSLSPFLSFTLSLLLPVRIFQKHFKKNKKSRSISLSLTFSLSLLLSLSPSLILLECCESRWYNWLGFHLSLSLFLSVPLSIFLPPSLSSYKNVLSFSLYSSFFFFCPSVSFISLSLSLSSSHSLIILECCESRWYIWLGFHWCSSFIMSLFTHCGREL